MAASRLPHPWHSETPGRPDTDSLEDLEPQFDDYNEQSDLEAAMVGLNDSFSMQGQTQLLAAQKIGLEGKATTNISSAQRDDKDQSADSLALGDGDASRKFFLSTDSPERHIDSCERLRGFAIPNSRRSPHLEAKDKGQKLGERVDTFGQFSSEKADDTALVAPVIKPGQPAWVHNFDPEFIAEWQDIVDFI